MSFCAAQQWFTCAQAGLQPLGHSYTPGTEETVEWGNNFQQTAPGHLLSVCALGDSAENKCLAACGPPRAHHPLSYLEEWLWEPWTNPALTLSAVTELQSQQVQKVFPCHFCPKYPCMVQMLHPGIDDFPMSPGLTNTKLLHIHWKIEGNWKSWAASKELCKKFSPKAYHILLLLFDYKYLWIQGTSKLCIFYLLKSLF